MLLSNGCHPGPRTPRRKTRAAEAGSASRVADSVLEPAFHQLAEEACARWQVPALAVGVSVDGRHETLCLGCEPGTRFRIASVTKPFTANLAAALLDLDAPAGTWPGVTPRHLLSHTAGYDCELGDVRRFGGRLGICEQE